MHLAVYTDADERGGAESAMGNFIERFSDDMAVTVLGPDEAVVRWLASRRPGARYSVLPPVRDRRDVVGMWQTRKAFRALDADIIHFNLSSMSSCQWAIVAAMSIPGQRYVVMEHSPVGTWSAMSQRLKLVTSRRAAAHVTVGHRAAELIELLGDLPPGSLRVIHSGVPVVELDPPPRSTEDFTVGMLSRHDPVKGIDLAIRMVGQLGDGYRLVVIGEGWETANLEALIEDLEVGDRVELRPFSEGARDLYPTFDVYLLPSRLEAFPVTIQEAMQAGVPVVATEVGSVREAIDDGETGFVVPVEDVDALADAVRRLHDEPELRRRMGVRAAEIGLERFDMAAGVAAWEALYREVLES
ncbi:MAG: glycosyltransferase family 4 protein [Actinomycetia bacterium]|nr:glycosyltransferase family 4 protein [Actinomycetes bacterium]